MILVHFKDNWADEFYIKGMLLVDLKKWNDMQRGARMKEYLSFRFGTNQEIDYDSADDFLNKFWSRPVNSKEAEMLSRLIPGIKSGYGIWPGELFDIIEDEKI